MKKKAFKAALPYTLPICVGFLFLGMSYGFLMRSMGFSFLYPMFMSMFIYAGSMEFVTANLLLSAFNPLSAFLLALMVNARHLFYGISMLDKYQNVGWKKFYLIYGMCDETFSVNCTTEVPEGVDKGWFMFFVTLLNQIYWVGGATAGALLGTMVTRFLPFLIFPEGKEPPEFIQYLGKVLPYAVIGLLVIYCLKDVPGSGTYGIPEFLAIAFIVLLHRWKKSILLSIGGGTVFYMLLVQYVFCK